ncbi:ABC transporter ATP-binding protein [Pseudonocardia xishanensis]|uniref:ABC transporter ATP-binding protein n=1 Tax=Pseudonocardia xishanensis TaxID=630995 RepID=A0ABP8RTK0_9PSEU
MIGVEVHGLVKHYGGAPVVRGLDLDVRPGEFLTLLGPSGCGKTTTLRCVAGLESPQAGEIRIGDRTVVGQGRFIPPEKRDIGMVFQSYALWPHLTVAGNVGYPLRRRGRSRAETASRVREVLDFVDLGHLADRSIGRLSGGQQQRVALARALAAQPQLLLFDEPLSNLDAKLRATLRDELRRLHATVGTTSIYVTHDQTEAMTLSTRVAVMNGGVVEQLGTAREVFDRPRTRFVADFVGIENLLDLTVEDVRGGTATARAVGLSVQVAAADPVSSGDPLCVGVRARAVRLYRPEEAPVGASTVSGVVTDRAFLGEEVAYRLDVGGVSISALVYTDPSRGRGHTDPDLDPGAPVLVELPTDQLVPLTPSGGPAGDRPATTEDERVPAGATGS